MSEAPNQEEPDDDGLADTLGFNDGDEDDIVPLGVARISIRAAGAWVSVDAATVPEVKELMDIALEAVSKLQTGIQ